MTAPAMHVGSVAAARSRLGRGALVMALPVALYGAALAVRLWVIGIVGFPANEGSAYYTAVAANMVDGRGLTIDALWSYATPPLVLPRPAFELWQPLASFVAAGPMLLLGTTFDAAQVGGALLGALLAPLAALVALDAANGLGINQPARRRWLALGSGLLVAVVAPLLQATALPDSTVPFAVAAVAAALLMSRTLSVGAAAVGRPALLLGVALGVAWLARHEAIWLGVVVLLLAAAAGRLNRRLAIPLFAGGLLAVGPWLARSVLVFGTPLPGQTIDNALLTANEQIFGYAARPTLEAFLAQGAPVLLGNVAVGTLHNLFFVLLAPAAPVVIGGLLAMPWLMRQRGLRTSALVALLGSGMLTFAVTSLVFPVATRWGTFEHAAGPLLVGLSVAAMLGVERLIVAVGRRRGWQRDNGWLAAAALMALSLPISGLVVTGLAVEADRQADRTQAIARAVVLQPEAAGGSVLIADRPIWLAEATGLPAIALPAEPLSTLRQLADAYDAGLVVVSAARGDYPELLRSPAASGCFEERTPAARAAGAEWPAGAAIFAVRAECRR